MLPSPIPARDPEEGGYALPPRNLEWKRARIALVIVLVAARGWAPRARWSSTSLHSRSVEHHHDARTRGST